MFLDIETQLILLVFALIIDRAFGDPDWLWRRLPHPVVIFGTLIGGADRRFNHDGDAPERRRLAGFVVLAALLAIAVWGGILLHALLASFGVVGAVIEILVVAIFIAQKSLADHVAAVAAGLRDGGIEGGRAAVSMIVGRDPKTLDHAGVSRAAIESLAENFSDGVVAPAFWYALFGLPGLFAYKMLNTADSMIGHKSPRHLDFGRAAAIADDWANWPASRLSALLVAVGAVFAEGRAAGRRALGCALRDHGLHRSPNAGWPEAAMAGALDIALAGPRSYAGERVFEPMLNAAGRDEATVRDIDRALSIYAAASTAGIVLVTLLAAISASS